MDLGDETEAGQDGRVIVSGLLPYMTIEELQVSSVDDTDNGRLTRTRCRDHAGSNGDCGQEYEADQAARDSLVRYVVVRRKQRQG